MFASIVVIVTGTDEPDANSGSHFDQGQERPQFCCGLRGSLYPATISLEQCHVVGRSPNFNVQPRSHTHSLSDFGQVPDSLCVSFLICLVKIILPAAPTAI